MTCQISVWKIEAPVTSTPTSQTIQFPFSRNAATARVSSGIVVPGFLKRCSLSDDSRRLKHFYSPLAKARETSDELQILLCELRKSPFNAKPAVEVGTLTLHSRVTPRMSRTPRTNGDDKEHPGVDLFSFNPPLFLIPAISLSLAPSLTISFCSLAPVPRPHGHLKSLYARSPLRPPPTVHGSAGPSTAGRWTSASPAPSVNWKLFGFLPPS